MLVASKRRRQLEKLVHGEWPGVECALVSHDAHEDVTACVPNPNTFNRDALKLIRPNSRLYGCELILHRATVDTAEPSYKLNCRAGGVA